MIRFSLNCEKDHGFEAWFGSNGDYEMQKQRGLVACPVCGSVKVEKALMAPAVASSAVHSEAQPTEETPSKASLAMDPKKREAMKALREMVKAVRAHSEDVGERFPEEARKIHHGESEARGIYGRASSEDAKALIEEGIEIAPLPEFPEDHS